MRLMDIVIMTTALGLIIATPGMTGGKAGFILIFASGITFSIQWMMMQLRTFELKGVSLERVAEYENLEVEDCNSLDPNNQYVPIIRLNEDDGDEGWPSKGAIRVNNLCAKYGPDLPEILHNITFDVAGGERIGIVGATGGGKSTLAKAFFSFVDITRGKIEIDGKSESCCNARAVAVDISL